MNFFQIEVAFFVGGIGSLGVAIHSGFVTGVEVTIVGVVVDPGGVP